MKTKPIREVYDVCDHFMSFLFFYTQFKEKHGLSDKLKNPYEGLVAMSDKLGRICRHVKHIQRKDPKPNFEAEISEEIFGLIAYCIMVANTYGLIKSGKYRDGMISELLKAVKQHARKRIICEKVNIGGTLPKS